MPSKVSKSASRGARRPAPRTLDAAAARGSEPWKAYWQGVADKLARYPTDFERWHVKAISDEEYAKRRGCFEECAIRSHLDSGEHVPLTDGFPALLVTYLGESGVTHRRHDGNRSMPSYIFSPAAGGAVRIIDPFDKFSYIRKAIANPETWDVAFDGGSP